MNTPNCYQAKAQTTRSRRQAAGKYATPAHKAAFAKLCRRGGAELLTRDDMVALSTHPHLLQSQREAWAAKAQAAA